MVKIHKPIRNYRCMYLDDIKYTLHDEMVNKTLEKKHLNNCSRVFSNIILGKEIGRGSYSSVFTAKATNNNGKLMNVAIKIIPKTNMDEMNYEVEFGFYMDESKIGPKIYDAFFIKKKSEYTQYIIMEAFDINVYSVLHSNIHQKTKNFVLWQIVKLMHKQLFDCRLECYDIKPGNFVYNRKTKVVKMIDFGSEFCNIDKVTKSKKEYDIILLALMIQFSYLIYQTNYDYIDDKYNFKINYTKVFEKSSKTYKKRYEYVDELVDLFRSNKKLKKQFIFYTHMKVDSAKDIIDILHSIDQ
jgi:serine/threonine protein kinase